MTSVDGQPDCHSDYSGLRFRSDEPIRSTWLLLFDVIAGGEKKRADCAFLFWDDAIFSPFFCSLLADIFRCDHRINIRRDRLRATIPAQNGHFPLQRPKAEVTISFQGKKKTTTKQPATHKVKATPPSVSWGNESAQDEMAAKKNHWPTSKRIPPDIHLKDDYSPKRPCLPAASSTQRPT